MHLNLIGLGRMGGGLARRLLRAGHSVSGYDRDPEERNALAREGGTAADTLEALGSGDGPRSFWIMVPAGPPVDGVLDELRPLLRPGDTVIDGGNSYYKDSMRRAESVAGSGASYLDCGVSGGVWGLEGGFCLMIGGDAEAVARHRPIFEALAPGADRGWAHVGPSGAGHFTKMVHNGIEYGLMQAYAEGFSLLESKTEFELDAEQIAGLWQHGSVIRSWLLELAERALSDDPELAALAPVVQDSGMGRWTAQEAIDQNVSAPVLTLSLLNRIASRDGRGFGNRMLAALRQQFGGHAVVKAETLGEGSVDA